MEGSVRLKLCLLVLVSVMGTAAIGAVAIPSTAGAVSCYGDYCSGQDPMATGCANDASVTDFVNGDNLRLELRWSQTCKTNWARVIVYPGWLAPFDLWAEQDTGYKQSSGGGGGMRYSTATPIWSRMIYSPNRCVWARVNHAPGYAWNMVSTRCA